ncbi:MAG TPA: caspase family protein [Anaeromyxobacteraceae bacterium]|nr:caspase family protein [Anaeromyxobacteraceae bacterium]
MKHALCIGINDYPGTDNDLAGCVNDADDWASELHARGFEVAKLVDRAATKAGITRAMSAVLGRAREGDVVVFTYSGHGTWIADRDGDEADGRDEALCPWNLADGPLVDDELHAIFARCSPGVRLTFVSDSCHSGTVARAATRPGPRARYMPPAAFVRDAARLRALARAEGRPPAGRPRSGALLLAGCQDSEYSYDAVFGKRANGAFTRAALDALKDLPAGADYATWFAEIRKSLPSRDYPQKPNLLGTAAQRRWPVLA